MVAEVSRYGTDSSGRPVYMTALMAAWWEGIKRELGFTPTIVQGAWMAQVAGGGADASAGFHDGGGCLDLRVWDLTATQQAAIIHATRWGGAASWLRDTEHGGFDPHIHLVLGADDGLSGGAAWQWLNYINGGDGLSSGGRDYHPRPTPLVLEPPDSLMEEDDMKAEDWTKMSALIDERLDVFAATAAEKIKLDNPTGKGSRWSLNTTLKSIWNRAGK